jgi:hypothetical protein
MHGRPVFDCPSRAMISFSKTAGMTRQGSRRLSIVVLACHLTTYLSLLNRNDWTEIARNHEASGDERFA